jgi:hypothetical protein
MGNAELDFDGGTMVMAAWLVTACPLKAAVTVKVTPPVLLPAVKVTAEPVVGLKLPRELLIDQEYVMLEVGHEEYEQTGMAVIP